MIDLKEEVRNGFLVDEARKNIWRIELEMLEVLAEICKKYALDWFLIGGSAIGAVRHKGFIPWDDDIDLGMKRSDFDIFVKMAEAELPDRFVLQYGLSDNDSEFHYFCRIRDKESTGIMRSEYGKKGVKGVFIEIYPFDNVPSLKMTRTIHWQISMALIQVIQHRVYGSSLGRKAKIINFLIKGKTVNELVSMWEKWCTHYNSRKTTLVETVSIPGYSASEVDLFFAEDIASTVIVPYEDTYVRIPVGNDRCLRKTYGDYMQLPPVEKRGTHHQTDVFYDPFLPYTEYENAEKLKQFFR